jgi:hypothetical protein
MSSLSRRIPDLEELFQAADDHAEAAGHSDYAIGDLQEILRAAWRVMTPKQRLRFFPMNFRARCGEVFEA